MIQPIFPVHTARKTADLHSCRVDLFDEQCVVFRDLLLSMPLKPPKEANMVVARGPYAFLSIELCFNGPRSDGHERAVATLEVVKYSP